MYELQDYDYTLPSELIAQTPAEPPESCKFLVYQKNNDTLQDLVFEDIKTLIDPDTLMICNNTKVVKARIVFDKKEIFFLKQLDTYTFEALVYP
jgi:S-adenosylmethionine:tRNA ribosyltransferase-isomerase